VSSPTGKLAVVAVLGKLPDNGSEQGGPGLIVEGNDDAGGWEVAVICLRPAPGREGKR